MRDWYVFCDICGRRYCASQTYRINDKSRGTLVVCYDDRDAVDYGAIPYRTPIERPIQTRTKRNNVDNASPAFNIEESTVEQIGSYIYLAVSQDTDRVLIIDDDIWIGL
jgi:hypothetical protein